MKKELVSVIIPAYNSEKYLKLAVDSVLNQTYSNIEILIIDDGSTDSTFSIAQELSLFNKNIQVLFHENHSNKGVSRSRKLGIDNAKGEYIAFLDADDEFEIDKIQTQINYFKKYPNVILSHTSVNLIGKVNVNDKYPFHISNDIKIYEYNKHQEFLFSNFICNSSVMVNHNVLNKIEVTQKQIFQYEDWLMWCLISYEGKFLYLPEKLTKYRAHSESFTSNNSSNILKPIYSSIEFIINFIIKTKDIKDKNKAKIILESLIQQLFQGYSSEVLPLRLSIDNGELNLNQVRDVSLRLIANNIEQQVKKINELNQKIEIINKEVSSIGDKLSFKKLISKISFFNRKK